jgi:hypothetical protein
MPRNGSLVSEVPALWVECLKTNLVHQPLNFHFSAVPTMFMQRQNVIRLLQGWFCLDLTSLINYWYVIAFIVAFSH